MTHLMFLKEFAVAGISGLENFVLKIIREFFVVGMMMAERKPQTKPDKNHEFLVLIRFQKLYICLIVHEPLFRMAAFSLQVHLNSIQNWSYQIRPFEYEIIPFI